MSYAKHTPGPWAVQGDGYDTATYVMGRDVLVREGTEDRIIAVCHSYRSTDRISRIANARLIAAAPTLLEALREAKVQVEILQERLGIKDTGAGTLSIINTALASVEPHTEETA